MEKDCSYLNNIQKIARIGWNVYYSDSAPEQSLLSFKEAYNQGFRILLCDVRFTKDGEMVCLHDETINSLARKSDGTNLSDKVYISEITLAEADRYDFGIYKGAQFKGTKLLRLTEFIEFCEKLSCTPHLELKVSPDKAQCDIIIALLKEYGFEKNVMFNGGKVDAMQYIASKLPMAKMGKWVGNITDSLINEIASYGKTNEKFIYVSNGYESSITEENYHKCLKNDVVIGYTEIRTGDELKKAQESGFLKYCKYVATRFFDLTEQIM